MLEDHGVEFEVVRYLDEPLAVEELDTLCNLLDVEPVEIVRTREGLFRELGLSTSDDRSRTEWLEILAAHPRLLQRPVAVRGDRAVIARPPATVLELT